MTLACRVARMQLPLVDSDRGVSGPMVGHVASCLRCQAESARYRSLRRNLAGLASLVEVAPDGLAADVSARIRGSAVPVDAGTSRSARFAAIAGAVAAAAGTFAMVRWLRTRAAA